MNIIQELEHEQINAVLAKRGVPEFGPGDTVKVMVQGDRRRPRPTQGQEEGRRLPSPRRRRSACRPTKAS